ncbi:GET complex subunit get1, partial [Ceratobasidium sp. 423]
IFLKSTVDRQRTLRADVLAAKRDLLQTSSQDQFAKWAKLRRRVDRGLAELDTINSTLASARTSFSVKFSTVLWVCTTGAQFFIVTHESPSILVEDHTSPSPPSSPPPRAENPSSPSEDTPGNNTSADEKSTGTTSARDRDRAELRARLAARQSARAAR